MHYKGNEEEGREVPVSLPEKGQRQGTRTDLSLENSPARHAGSRKVQGRHWESSNQDCKDMLNILKPDRGLEFLVSSVSKSQKQAPRNPIN